jgi:hypothetical protein
MRPYAGSLRGSGRGREEGIHTDAGGVADAEHAGGAGGGAYAEALRVPRGSGSGRARAREGRSAAARQDVSPNTQSVESCMGGGVTLPLSSNTQRVEVRGGDVTHMQSLTDRQRGKDSAAEQLTKKGGNTQRIEVRGGGVTLTFPKVCLPAEQAHVMCKRDTKKEKEKNKKEQKRRYKRICDVCHKAPATFGAVAGSDTTSDHKKDEQGGGGDEGKRWLSFLCGACAAVRRMEEKEEEKADKGWGAGSRSGGGGLMKVLRLAGRCLECSRYAVYGTRVARSLRPHTLGA